MIRPCPRRSPSSSPCSPSRARWPPRSSSRAGRWRRSPPWPAPRRSSRSGPLSVSDARDAIGDLGPTVGFLAALLVLAEGCRREGLFDAMGGLMAAGARGSPRRLLALVFAVAAAVTAVLSLDATVVLLTPDRLRHRRAAAHEPAPARLRVLAPGQLGVAAAAGLQPDQPARLPRQRAVVHALRRAHGAPDGRRRRGRVDRADALLRGRPRPPAAARAAAAASARRCRASRSPSSALTLAGLRGELGARDRARVGGGRRRRRDHRARRSRGAPRRRGRSSSRPSPRSWSSSSASASSCARPATTAWPTARGACCPAASAARAAGHRARSARSSPTSSTTCRPR